MVPSQQAIVDVPGLARQYVVLCTDGEPNGCPSSGTDRGGGSLATDFEGPKKEVTAAAASGIKTYVVSVASGGAQYQQFLDALAQIGNTGSPAFSPSTKDDLVAQLTSIIGSAIGCQIQLNGKVATGKECTGTVTLNSKNLECNNANGWKLIDQSHIELVGSACKTFMNDRQATLSVTFPCGAVDLL
jgi:hypothetical protein